MTQSLHPLVAGWRDKLRAAVSPLGSGVGHLQVRGYKPPDQDRIRPGKTAAVLVPLLDLEEPEIVLTRRADHLPQHAGQVSFPGGAAEPGDTSAVHTALREAFEEIGLPPAQTLPLGFLDRLDTISDYRVLPIVALVQPPVVWKPDFREVAEVFTVPWSFAMDLSRYEKRPIERAGVKHTLWYLQYERHTIWGATAMMLLNLAVRYRDVDNASPAVVG